MISLTVVITLPPIRPVVDPQLQDLISRLLAKDPHQRITMQEIKVMYYNLLDYSL